MPASISRPSKHSALEPDRFRISKFVRRAKAGTGLQTHTTARTSISRNDNRTPALRSPHAPCLKAARVGVKWTLSEDLSGDAEKRKKLALLTKRSGTKSDRLSPLDGSRDLSRDNLSRQQRDGPHVAKRVCRPPELTVEDFEDGAALPSVKTDIPLGQITKGHTAQAKPNGFFKRVFGQPPAPKVEGDEDESSAPQLRRSFYDLGMYRSVPKLPPPPNALSRADEEDLSSKPRCRRCRDMKKGCDRQRPCGRCKEEGIGIDGCTSEDESSGRIRKWKLYD